MISIYIYRGIYMVSYFKVLQWYIVACMKVQHENHAVLVMLVLDNILHYSIK